MCAETHRTTLLLLPKDLHTVQDKQPNLIWKFKPLLIAVFCTKTELRPSVRLVLRHKTINSCQNNSFCPVTVMPGFDYCENFSFPH